MVSSSIVRSATAGWILVLLAALTAAQDVAEPPKRDYWPTRAWKTERPENHGLDPGILGELKKKIEEELIYSAVIVKDGYIVFEYYKGDLGRDSRFLMYSCTKSFTSALIGICIDKGYIKGTDQKISEFFPYLNRPGTDDRKKRITLHHLLTMTAGFEWSDRTHYGSMIASTDRVSFLLVPVFWALPRAEAQDDKAGNDKARNDKAWYVLEKQVSGPGSGKDRPTSEMWLGDGQVTYIMSDRILIIDRNKKRMIFANRRNKTSVERPLPLDLSKLYADQLAMRFKAVKNTGAVKETGEIRTVLARKCKGYGVKLWKEYKGRKTDINHLTVWATEDVPFDWKQYNLMFEILRKIYNRDEVCRKELNKIRGHQMATEFNTRGGEVISYAIVEISRKKPPAGVYAAPEGFTRKEKITKRDFS